MNRKSKPLVLRTCSPELFYAGGSIGRAADSKSAGWGFESLPACHFISDNPKVLRQRWCRPPPTCGWRAGRDRGSGFQIQRAAASRRRARAARKRANASWRVFDSLLSGVRVPPGVPSGFWSKGLSVQPLLVELLID